MQCGHNDETEYKRSSFWLTNYLNMHFSIFSLLEIIMGIMFCQQAGYEYDEETFEKIFRRIYASFGSSAPYSIFPDSQPFLRWVHEQGLKVGIVSNAEYRYQDVILPALSLNKVNKVFCFGILVPKFLD